MNTYYKFAPTAWIAKCEEEYEKGDIIDVTNKYGQPKSYIVYNLIANKNNCFYYSIIREDGFNYAQNKAERYQQATNNAYNKSSSYFDKANEGREFLALGEPIKVGHHSEHRHRSLLERNDNRMRKGFEELDKKARYEEKLSYWNSKINDIDLSMPESLDYFEVKLTEAQEHHAKLKSGEIARRHSYDLSYSRKKVKELEDKLKIAIKMWS